MEIKTTMRQPYTLNIELKNCSNSKFWKEDAERMLALSHVLWEVNDTTTLEQSLAVAYKLKATVPTA